MRVIGIAGGSGVGKSTVSYELVDGNPDKFEVINLDDYQKLKTEPALPMMDGMINWDHPDIIRWNDLRRDINKLKTGQEVQIDVWAHRSNADYAQHGQMISRTIHPRPVLIIEGYLALYKEIIDVYDKSFYLELDEENRAHRRKNAVADKDTIIAENDYVEKVLKPMHAKFVEPTKQNADVVIHAHDRTVQEIVELILGEL